MFDYETLRIIWWVLLGVLLIGFAVMDGFDLGAATLLPFIGKNESERRIIINSVGPVWEGNQVWLILGAGAIFAAWPYVYAVAFSGFYLAMFLILSALIIRPVSFKFRSKVNDPRWTQFWDRMLFVSGFVPSLLFGVAVGNVLQGVPFQFDDFLRMSYQGTLLQLLNPFALLCGLISLAMVLMQGSIYLAIKTEDPIVNRTVRTARIFALITIILFGLAGLWVNYLDGYVVNSNTISQFLYDAPSNPLNKSVIKASGLWLHNYQQYPFFQIAPLLAFIGCILAFILVGKFKRLAFIASSMGIFGVISTVGLSMFPFILPSSNHPNHSLLVWDSSSSFLTLKIMLAATCVFLPLILLYTSWVFWVLRGKVTSNYVSKNAKDLY